MLRACPPTTTTCMMNGEQKTLPTASIKSVQNQVNAGDLALCSERGGPLRRSRDFLEHAERVS